MLTQIDIQNRRQAEKFLALQKESYQAEADLIGFDQIPPLIEPLEELMSSQEQFWVLEEDGEWKAGMALEINENIICLSRLIVDPDHFRQGYGQQLVQKAIDIARVLGRPEIQVTTALKNTPAMQLYMSLGFQEVKQEAYNEQLTIVSFRLLL